MFDEENIKDRLKVIKMINDFDVIYYQDWYQVIRVC